MKELEPVLSDEEIKELLNKMKEEEALLSEEERQERERNYKKNDRRIVID